MMVLTGPGGSGKTSVSNELAKKYTRFAAIHVDEIKHFVSSGFFYDDSEEGKKQWVICTENVIAVAKNFLADGYTVFIEGFLGNHDRRCWNRLFATLPIKYKFLLFPEKQENLDRDVQRISDDQLGKETVEKHWDFFARKDLFYDFQRIDSTNMSVEETADIIFQACSKNE